MTTDRIAKLLREVRRGRVGVDEALDQLRSMPYEDLGYAKIDHHRPLRQGMPEVIFGRGKTPEQVEHLVERMLPHGHNILVTRGDAVMFERVRKLDRRARFHAASGAIGIRLDRKIRGKGLVLVVTAGTTDIPVAEEAMITAEVMGNRVQSLYDVGVAGLHRLLGESAALKRARVVIVAAGMEGALPSVGGRTCSCARDCRTYQRRLRRQLSRLGGPAWDDEQLRAKCSHREYRQRLRRRLPGQRHQSPLNSPLRSGGPTLRS